MNQTDNRNGTIPQIPSGQQQTNPPFINPPQKKGGCLKIGLIVFAVFVIIGIIGAIFSDDKDSNTTTENKKDMVISDSINEPQSIEQEPTTSWTYSESIDEMTDKTTYLASVASENEANFDFPYDGGSTLTLTVRRSPQFGNDIYIRISKGQFNIGINGESIKVRFDNDQPMTFNCTGASDNSTDILFISNYKKFITRLKTADTVKIAAEFFNEGIHTFTFNTKGLNWNH